VDPQDPEHGSFEIYGISVKTYALWSVSSMKCQGNRHIVEKQKLLKRRSGQLLKGVEKLIQNDRVCKIVEIAKRMK
jgi:hypothetical protein